MEGFFLITIWIIQIVLYSLLTFNVVHWKIKKSTILLVAVGLFLIAPWLFPVNGGYNSETDEYTCGLASLIPFSIFWLLGNTGNLILILIFSLISFIRSKIN